MGAARWWLAPGQQQASRWGIALPRVAETLGGGTDGCLAGEVSPLEEGRRRTHRYERSVHLYRHDSRYGQTVGPHPYQRLFIEFSDTLLVETNRNLG
jgi:hypothetical protein